MGYRRLIELGLKPKPEMRVIETVLTGAQLRQIADPGVLDFAETPARDVTPRRGEFKKAKRARASIGYALALTLLGAGQAFAQSAPTDWMAERERTRQALELERQQARSVLVSEPVVFCLRRVEQEPYITLMECAEGDFVLLEGDYNRLTRSEMRNGKTSRGSPPN